MVSPWAQLGRRRGRNRWFWPACLLGASLLIVQVAFVVYAHLVQPASAKAALNGCSAEPQSCTRYFAWAPNDYEVTFGLRVVVDGRALSSDAALARYHLGSTVWEFPVGQLTDIIRQYEQTNGKGQDAKVALTYRINDRAPATWNWPS